MLYGRARVVEQCLARVAVLLLIHATAASAADDPASAPCAACITFAVAPDEEQAARTAGVDAAVVVPLASAATMRPLEIVTDVIVIDAREAAIGDDAARYTIRSFATAFRAAHALARVGIEVLAAQSRDEGLRRLAAYLDFVVMPPDAPLDQIVGSSGLELWTAAPSTPATAVDAIAMPRLPGSDRLLTPIHAGDLPLARSVAAWRDIVPAGLTSLPDVTVSCDGPCDAAVYLHPDTLEAIALVRPRAPVTRVSVAPTALELTALADREWRATGPALDVPPLKQPFLLRIRGWRGTAGESFATGVQVSGTRELRVDEIVARHQIAHARQDAAVRTLISSGASVMTVQVPGFAGPLTVTAQTTNYAGGAAIEIEERQIRINGLDLSPRAGEVPRLPLIEPERVGAPPLAIVLTEAYRYALDGRARVNGRDTYVVSFEPVGSDRPLAAGRAWIDALTFGLVRVDATQTGLRGPIVSSRQIDELGPVEYQGSTAWLPRRSEVFQVYQGPTQSTPIHRVVTFSRHEINPPDYVNRLDEAHRSDAIMLRDTPQGLRFLVRDRTSPRPAGAGDPQSGPFPRKVAQSAIDHVATAVVGALIDPNISVPLVFAGVSYVDFNLLDTGAQLNAFAGGTYGRLSWSTPPLFGGWRIAGDGSGVAVSYNDRAFSHGVERYEENIRQRPLQASVALVGPIATSVRLRASYDVSYTAYARSDTTSPAFIVPSSTPVHAARVTLEGERGPWTASVWGSVALRQRWHAWGPGTDSARSFERFGATLARSLVWSPRAIGRFEAAWMSGRRLDRFSQFAFGTFDNPLRGYPAVSIRYESGAVLRTVATWNAGARMRIDGFADCGIVRAPQESRVRAYPGVGAAAEIPAPFGWLAAVEWGYGIKGVNSNSATGTHVVRVSGYKIF